MEEQSQEFQEQPGLGFHEFSPDRLSERATSSNEVVERDLYHPLQFSPVNLLTSQVPSLKGMGLCLEITAEGYRGVFPELLMHRSY